VKKKKNTSKSLTAFQQQIVFESRNDIFIIIWNKVDFSEFLSRLFCILNFLSASKMREPKAFSLSFSVVLHVPSTQNASFILY
jgi:hypothetical protein